MEIEYKKSAGASVHRQRIICAAKRVFYVKGYKKATIDDIAREADIRPEVIYRFFRNKQELYASLSMSTLHRRLIQHLADIFYDTAQGTIRPKLSSKDLAVEVLGKFFGIIQQEPDPQSTSGKYYQNHVETKLETAFNLIVRRLNNCEVKHE